MKAGAIGLNDFKDIYRLLIEQREVNEIVNQYSQLQ